MILLKRIQYLDEKDLTSDQRHLLKTLSSLGDLNQIILEIEFVVYQWRIIRFLRAIGDMRINMHKQSISEFVNWAHKETGLSKKLIFNQIFIFQGMVGYAPVYSIFGASLRELQLEAINIFMGLRSKVEGLKSKHSNVRFLTFDL